MESIRKSRKVALDILEDTKDVIEGISAESPVANVRLRNVASDNIDFNTDPSTSKQLKSKRPTEYVKYSKITFNTTAILHHYPQMQNKNCAENQTYPAQKVATKKSDLNLPIEPLMDNNNGVNSANKETKITLTETKIKDKDNDNNNDGTVKASNAKSDNAIEVLKKPVKFTEEKLV